MGTAGAATTTTTGEGTVTEVVTGKAEGEGTIGSRASTNWPSCTVTSRWVANFEATLKMERGWGVGGAILSPLLLCLTCPRIEAN